MIHLIKEIIDVAPYRLDLRFNTGEIRVVDLKEDLQSWADSTESSYLKLLDPEYFRTVRLNAEFQSGYWDNGIELCPDFLYRKSQLVALARHVAS